jgi:hypothetical protein
MGVTCIKSSSDEHVSHKLPSTGLRVVTDQQQKHHEHDRTAQVPTEDDRGCAHSLQKPKEQHGSIRYGVEGLCIYALVSERLCTIFS